MTARKPTGVPFEAMEKEYLDRISLRRMTVAGRRRRHGGFPGVHDAGRNISGQSLGVDGNVECLISCEMPSEARLDRSERNRYGVGGAAG